MTTAPVAPAVERRPVAGAMAVLFAVTVWGGVAVVAKLVDEIDGVVLGFHRLWIATAVTVAIFMLRGGRLSWRLLRLSGWGGLAFAADIILFFSALKHTTVANATVIGALQPALVLLVAGRMFGERINAAIITWSLIAIGGVVVVMYGSSGTPVWSLKGDLLALGALLAWTGYFIASKQVRRELNPFEYLTGMVTVATLLVTPLALLSGSRLDPGSPGDWAWIVLLAVGSGGFGHLLINWAHDHVDLSVMSLLTLAVPIVAVISAALFLDEEIVLTQVLGMAVVVVALGVVVRNTTAPATSSRSSQ